MNTKIKIELEMKMEARDTVDVRARTALARSRTSVKNVHCRERKKESEYTLSGVVCVVNTR